MKIRIKLTGIICGILAVGMIKGSTVYGRASVQTERFDGKNRYETAAKVCEKGWTGDSEYAVLVNGENFADALTAAPLAKKYDAPILLTGGTVLDIYTSMQINRLGVEEVFIIGGKGVISQNIEDGIKSREIKVTRLGGDNRYETALEVASKLGRVKQIAVINGYEFYDGVSIAPIAALKGMPIIPVSKNYMPESIEKYLKRYKRADQIYVIGGTDQISESVKNKIPNALRVGSGDIYKRNSDIINAFQNELNFNKVFLASARDYADALSASALAPKTDSPIVFIDSPINYNTKQFLKSKIINSMGFLGGTGSINYNTEQIAKSLPLKVSDTENITKTIWQKEKFVPQPTVVVTASNGVPTEVPVEWNLIKVDTTKPGVYNFTGEIFGYDKKINLTLIVKPLPVKVEDIDVSYPTKYSYRLPSVVKAQMSDGSESKLDVKWDYGTQQSGKSGIYVFYGIVDHYNKKVKLTLTITQQQNAN